MYEQLLTSSGDATPFLEQETTLAPTTRQRLLSITQDTQKNQKLQLELVAVIDAGDPFVRATYKLEGDGALVFDCFDVLSSLAASIQTSHFPNLTAVSAQLSFLQVILVLVSSFFSMDDLVYNLVLTTFLVVLEETFVVVLLLLKPLDYSFLRKSRRCNQMPVLSMLLLLFLS